MRNIVLVTADSVRADHCRFMGYKRETTPNLDKMAKKGLCFENAYAPSSRTLPSMVSFFTGDLITEYINCNSLEKFGENGKLNLKRKKTLAEALSERGYTTGAFNPNTYASRYFGFDKGFDYFRDFLFDAGLFDRYFKGGKLAHMIRNVKILKEKNHVFKTWESYYEDIINWIENAEEPFFLWVFLLDTHFPFLSPRKYRKWTNLFDMYYSNWIFYKTIRDKKIYFSEKGKNKLVNAYDSSLYYADHFFNHLLKDSKDYDPLIIFHSDHGENFGERGLWGHGHFRPCLYEENTHVPLIIYNANIKKRVDKPVSLLDLYPTLLNFADTEKLSSSALTDGKEWAISKDIDYFRGGVEIFSVRLGKWKFITGQNEMDELYNIKEDPNEQENMVGEYPKLVEKMKSIVKSYIKHEVEKRRIRERASRLKGKYI